MHSTRLIGNERGQMAIFIALIFQVLFVFFAMVINIGLLVHDKINLQNAVDLAAYYGAQRQAEILNEIAHINYQVRQANKLLAFRHRVIGEFGLTDHPSNWASKGDLLESSYQTSSAPQICISHRYFKEYRAVDPAGALCKDRKFEVPEFKPLKVEPLVGALNAPFAAIIDSLRQNQSDSCKAASQLNWLYAATILYGYRQDIALRRILAQALADNLSKDTADFFDIHGESVRAGVEKTLKKNLTIANRDGLKEWQFFNGLPQGNCRNRDFWLAPVFIDPQVVYNDFLIGGNSKCTSRPKQVSQQPDAGYGNGQALRPLIASASGEPLETDVTRSLWGFEKNPWCMTYVGVRAKTAPRKPFAPFGKEVQLEARAYAQPFGGRIGPWYYAAWPSGSSQSNGGEDLKVDRFAVPRSQPEGSTQVPNGKWIPNYSRYPGDKFGLGSRLALGVFRGPLGTFFGNQNNALTLEYYKHYFDGKYSQSADLLAWDGNKDLVYRAVEYIAVAPDLFDITYYSIEPKFFDNYLLPNQKFKFSGETTLAPDIGGRLENGAAAGGDGLFAFSVIDQLMPFSTGKYDLPPPAQAFYLVRDWKNVLTSWAQEKASSYESPDQRLGQCYHLPDEKGQVPYPGNCVGGGRTGYSVRLVSREYLTYGQHELGGAEGSTGPILNPPAEGF